MIIMYVHKIVYLASIAALFFLTTGCKKFLDYQPKDKVPQATLFNDEQGFKDALTGIYLAMDKPQNGGNYGLYTNNLSMGMASVLGYNYNNATTPGVGLTSTFYNNVVYYVYTDATVKNEIAGIWAGMYSNIANLNNILTQIDSRKDVFSTSNFNLVKGEAVALRALFHFDLLRLFGQPPLAGPNVKSISYITRFGIQPVARIPVMAVLDSCITDLKLAKNLLSLTDTAAVVQGTYDPFTSYTQNHLNYWAVQALLARVYLYKGDHENAGSYARAVIGSNKFPLITSNVASSLNAVRDRTFSQEHLFSVYSSNVLTYNNSQFNPTSGVPLQLNAAGKTALYNTGSSGSANDYRLISWFDNSVTNMNVPSKFFQDANLPYHLQNIMPVIRVSEMYYIAAENAISKGDVTGSLFYLNKVRQARGLSALPEASVPSADHMSTEIMKEYQKEFIQEGQTWFYYKRLNKDLKQVTLNTIPVLPPDVYVFPLPDKELEYNNL